MRKIHRVIGQTGVLFLTSLVNTHQSNSHCINLLSCSVGKSLLIIRANGAC